MVTATRAGAVAQPTVALKPKKTRAAPKATAAATSGVVKQPTRVKGTDGGKKPTKAQAAKIRKDKATEKARVKREEKVAEKAAKKTAAEVDEDADEDADEEEAAEKKAAEKKAAEKKAAEKKAAEKKAAEKETAEKTPDEEPEKPTEKSATDKKKNKGDQAEPQDPDGNGDKDDDVPNSPGKPGQPDGGGDDDPAPDSTPPPPPGGPGDDKGGQAAEPRTDAEILDSLYPELEERQRRRRRRQLGPNEVLIPPTSSVTHEVEIFPAEIKYTAPGYDGTRLWLPRAGSARDGTTFTSAAFATAPYAFQYKDARWIKAHKDPIGSGSFGQADLYLQQDPSGNIVQRIVVKTTQIPHNMWTEAKRWHVDSLNPTKAEHMEIKVMEQIANVDGNHKCVRLEHYTTDRPTFSYRLYMGYHPHGNLVQFTKDRSFYNNRRKIPEPVLWKWFEDLTEAGLLMSTGAEPGVDAKVGWKKIVHCDFKPLNVFLDAPDAKRWRSYPQAIVGDFGESVFTDEKDPFNPTWYNAQYAGTNGWVPPEQRQFVDLTTKRLTDTGKLGDASNVWAIGAVIMRLMNTDKDPQQPSYVHDVKKEMEPQLNHDAKRVYSQYLCDLVNLCVRFRTYNRIELPELWNRIKRYTGETIPGYDPDEDGDDKKRFDELQRDIREQMDGDGSDESRLKYPEEKHKIGGPGAKDKGQGNEEQGGGQGDEDLDDEELDGDNQLYGGSGGENLLGVPDGGDDDDELEEFLQGELGGAKLGDLVRYPGDPRGTFDENYDDDEDEDE